MAKVLGTKIKRVRESLHLTQEQVSRGTGLSSEFISLIEKGKRSPSLDSLEKIAVYLNKKISYFLDEESDPFEKIMKDKGIPKSTQTELKNFKKYCTDYLDMEKTVGSTLEEAPLYSLTSPKLMADEERKRLGLGIQPIQNIFALLEINGLRIFRQALKKSCNIAGAFVYFKSQTAGFALVNSNQSYAKQILTTAHEYCHYLKDRKFTAIIDNPDIFIDDYLPLYPTRERFAHIFSLSFLIPDDQIHIFISRECPNKKIKIENIILLKRYLGMPLEIVLNSLFRMNYIDMSEYREYLKQEYLDYEKSLYGSIIGEKESFTRKTKIIPSDRYKTLAVQALKEKK